MLHIIGAGLPRTATFSLRQALTSLLGGHCYHMAELFNRPEHLDTWLRALDGEEVDWREFLDPYVGAVDWPAAAFWPEIARAFPEAVVLLSEREDAATWWRSAEHTVISAAREPGPGVDERWVRLVTELWNRLLGEDWTDPDQAMKAYDDYLVQVKDTVPEDRLIVWQPEQGWAPLCDALGFREPAEAFPHLNTGGSWEERRRRGKPPEPLA